MQNYNFSNKFSKKFIQILYIFYLENQQFSQSVRKDCNFLYIVLINQVA